MNFQTFVFANNCRLFNISAKAKTIVLPHKKFEVVTLHKSNITHTTNKIAENTENSPNSCTIHNRTQNYEKISPIVTQNWHFLKCHNNCSSNKNKLLIHKSIKAAIDCSYIYCEGRHSKVLQTCVFLFKRTIVFTGVKKSIGIIAQNIKQINSTQNKNSSKKIS